MKKTIYVTLATILGFLLSILLHVVIEVFYLRWLRSQGETPVWHDMLGKLEALPIWLVVLLGVAGIGFGLWLGFTWWRIVYVEKRHWRFHNEQHDA